MFAHVGHKDNVICVASCFDSLPTNYRVGLILHELGHLFTDMGDEKEADTHIYDTYNRTQRIKERLNLPNPHLLKPLE